MNGNHWQTGGVEVTFSFGLYGCFCMIFPRGYLPLGQQYPPLHRKPDLGFLLGFRLLIIQELLDA